MTGWVSGSMEMVISGWVNDKNLQWFWVSGRKQKAWIIVRGQCFTDREGGWLDESLAGITDDWMSYWQGSLMTGWVTGRDHWWLWVTPWKDTLNDCEWIRGKEHWWLLVNQLQGTLMMVSQSVEALMIVNESVARDIVDCKGMTGRGHRWFGVHGIEDWVILLISCIQQCPNLKYFPRQVLKNADRQYDEGGDVILLDIKLKSCHLT